MIDNYYFSTWTIWNEKAHYVPLAAEWAETEKEAKEKALMKAKTWLDKKLTLNDLVLSRIETIGRNS